MNDDSDNVIHVDFGLGGGRRREPSKIPPSRGNPVATRGRHEDPVADLYSVADVAKLFGLSLGKLRYWDRSGFIEPSGRRGEKRLYTFEDLISVRAAKSLLDQGVPLRSVRLNVEALRASLPKVLRPLGELRVVADGAKVVVRDRKGSYEPSTGQLVLDFQVETLREDVVRTIRPRPADEGRRQAAYQKYLEGCRLDEDELTSELAERAYREAIALDPSLANALTNLGNLRYRRGDVIDAESLYSKALALDPEQPEAHYNLGFLQYERGDVVNAIECFRRALAVDPGFADAHFNLAMALEDLGHPRDARFHWESYLALDPTGPWAEIASNHLREQGS